MSKSCFRGPGNCRNVATRKSHLKTDQVCLYLLSTKDGIIFSQVLAMEHLQNSSDTSVLSVITRFPDQKFGSSEQIPKFRFVQKIKGSKSK